MNVELWLIVSWVSAGFGLGVAAGVLMATYWSDRK